MGVSSRRSLINCAENNDLMIVGQECYGNIWYDWGFVEWMGFVVSLMTGNYVETRKLVMLR